MTSPTSYAWFGNGSRPLAPEVVAAAAPRALRDYLVEAVQHELYRSFYCSGKPVPADREPSGPARSDEAFVDALSRANCGAGGWQPGWTVRATQDGAALVATDGLRVRAPIRDCLVDGCRLEPGVAVALRRSKERRAVSPGFYTALGDTEPDPAARELRLYFHVTAVGAARLVRVATRRLNGAGVPFDLKVIDHPTGFARCDAAVLYLEACDFPRARPALRAIAAACARHLRAGVPAFTAPLARGVAAGEHEPTLGDSFGAARCRLVADGIVAAYEQGATRLARRLDVVAGRFAEHGLDVDAPYRGPGSTRSYAL